jgi:hypothetical protein
MPLITSDFEFSDDYPTIEPSLRLDFANARALDPRITFTRASTATYVGANGLIKTAGEDEARFDHDPATGESLGLLIEESRTNLITQSGDISQFSQATPNNQTLTANAAVAPDGTTTATRYTTNTSTGNNLQWINKNVSGSYSNVTVTGSFWARGDATKTLTAHITDGIAGTSYNYTVTTEWQRFTFTKTQNTGAAVAGLYPVFISNEPAGLNIYLWGAQLEVGSFPTSYIPTSGSTATRATDIAKITGTNFTDFYNQSEGTLVLSADIGDLTASNQVAVAFEDTSNVSASFIAMGYNAGGGGSGHVGAWYNSSGITSAFKTHNIGVTINTEFRQSFAYKLDDFSSVVNGGAPLTDNSGGITTLIDRVRFGNYHYGGMTSGHIKQFTYYPKRLTNAQLQTLTQ